MSCSECKQDISGPRPHFRFGFCHVTCKQSSAPREGKLCREEEEEEDSLSCPHKPAEAAPLLNSHIDKARLRFYETVS